MGVALCPPPARIPIAAGRAMVLVAAFALAAAGCLPELASLEDRACDADGRCAAGFVCDEATNVCVSEGGSSGCVLDEECPGEEICVAGRCEPPDEPPECTNNEDCPGERICVGGECRDPDPPPECEEDTDCPGDEICDAGVCREVVVTPECTDGALRPCDLTTGEPVTSPACGAGLQHCRADLTWSDCAAADHQDPYLELDGPAADGFVHLEDGESVTVPIYDVFDPRAGTIAGDDFRWWVQGRADPVPGHRTAFRIGTEGTDANIALEAGLHLVAVEITDPCGGQAVVGVRVQVGDPFDAPFDDESVQALCFTPLEQPPPTVVVGAGAVARSLDADLTENETHVREGLTVRACEIGTTQSQVAWSDGAITRHLLGHFDQTGTNNPNRVQILTDPGEGEVPLGGLTRDGYGWFWRIRGGRLAYNDGGTTYSVMDAPPHAGPTWVVHSVAYDGAGGLWVGTSEGINRLDVSGASPAEFTWRWDVADVDVLGLAGGPAGGAVTAIAASPDRVFVTGAGWPARIVALPTDVVAPDADDVELVDLIGGPDVDHAPRIPARFDRLAIWGGGPAEEILAAGPEGVVRVAWTQRFSGSGVPEMWLRLVGTPAADVAAEARDGEWHLLSATAGGVARYRGR